MVIPTAETSQIIAADVRPMIRPREWRIVPAPRKPIPVTTCAAIRPGSLGLSNAITMATFVDSHMNSIDPRQIRMLVRKPAGLSLISRSTPMSPPQTIARSAFTTKSLTRGLVRSQDSGTIATAFRPSKPPEGGGYNYILFQGDAMNRTFVDPHGATRPVPAVSLLLAGACLGAALLALVSAAVRQGDAAGAPAVAAAPLRSSQDGYAAVARAVMPAVVNISSYKVIRTYQYSPFLVDPFFRDFFGEEFPGLVVPRDQRAMSLGSGVIVDDQGTILTNYHVVEQAQEVKAALGDGREMPARIVGADQRTDLAVLRVEKDSLPHAVMGDSE